ncbi:MAG: S-layer homology domain-containing protein, partial [Eubacteriales bacterium]|nr:S-layer homology domain-containing protein [Eubacteriales bacterium]
SAIKVNGKFYTSENIESLVGKNNDDFYLKLNSSTPIEVIRDAWGVMESVTLDGKKINYAKDWKGTVERMDNSKDHTLKFTWKPLASELVNAGYTYRTTCEHYISGSTAVQQTDTIDASKTSHTITIEKGADPKVYSYDLQLNLDKNGSSVGIFTNNHIVKLVVSEAPEVKTLTGKASYINSAVFGKPVLFSGTITPGVYIWECQFQWQRSTDGGSTWKDIPDATDGQYIPGAADMGENVRIRVVITKKGYLGEIVSAPAKVSKAANDNTPSLPNVTAQKNADGTYTAFQISNFKSDQEYIYTTSAPTSGNGWPTGGTPITSATVNGLNKGSTYYIFTRYKGTDTHQTGSKVSSTSVLLDEITMLNRVILTDANGRKYNFYGSGNIIYIKKGESVTLTAKTNPVGATTWSGFTFKSQYSASAPFTVTAPTGPVASGSTIPSVTIRGDKAGTGTLAAEYGGYPAPQSYGTWRVHVYENVSDIGTAADIIVAPSFPDLTMRPGETMPLPEYAVSVYPKGALDNYTLEWRIIKVGSGGAAYSMRDDHMTLENGKIEPTKAHTGSEKTRLELVAVNKTKPTNISSFSPSVGFYITVGDAPLVELTGLTLTPKKVDLEVGKTCQLSAVKEPANAEGSLTWTSSKPAVAAVDQSGKVTAKGEGTATITVTCGTKSAACTVTVSKPLVPEVPGTTFTDVPAGAYYEEAVGWAVEKGITKGTSDSTFTPDGVCTRAQAVTFLWRAAGSPAAKAGSLPFADVKAGSYYDDAVRWAVENGVTVGTSATTFSPNATCSRAQIVTFLWRAQKSPAAGSANPFDDVAGSAYYADAVQWAVQKDITKGTGATAFSPDANCIRAQIVTFLYRSMK